MVVHMRSTRAHTGNRRSHHKVAATRLSTCECGASYVRHTACQACGKYRGRQVIDIVAKTERAQRRAGNKQHELMASNQVTTQEEAAAKTDKSAVK
jgi:large subunit ribosomal protein L32